MKNFTLTVLRASLVLCILPFSTNAQNNALLFDGTNDHVTFTTAPSFTGSGTMTFEAWINPSSVSVFQTIAHWQGTSNNVAQFSINSSGFLDLFQSDGANSGSLVGTVAINANEWTHIAFVQDAGSIDFYVNGALEVMSFPVGPAGTSPAFFLGSTHEGAVNFGGLMDEVRIWSSALTQTTIRDQMFRTLTGSESNLVAYYQFNETTGTTLPDLTTSNFDGTLTNFPATTDPNWQESGATPKNSLDFDGVDDYVDLGGALSYTSMGTQDNFSVELWVNLEPVFTDTRRGSIFSINDGGGANLNRLLLYINDGSDPGKENRLGVVDAGINPDFDILGPIIADDTWHHIAYTRSGTTGTLYIDGLQVGTHTADFTFESGDVWSLGQEFDGISTMSDFIDGQIDDVRIWGIARTEAEIQANMFTDLVGNEANLNAYYDFNQGFAGGSNSAFTTLIDRSTNSYDGTLGSFALTGTSSNWVSSGAQVPAPEITVYSGTNVSAPEVFDGQPKPVDFGHTPIATTKPLTFTIENIGFDDLVVSDIVTTGDFSITTSTSFTVTAGSTASFTSELLALSDGIANGTIAIQTNDPNELNFVFPVTGTKGTLPPKAYWTDETGTFDDEIDRVDMLTGANGQNAYYSGFSVDIKGIAVDKVNNMVFWTDTDGQVRCGRIGDATFTAENTVLDESGASARPFLGIDVDGNNGKVYWCDSYNGKIRRIDFDGTNGEDLVDVGSPRDIEISESEGKIYYLVNDSGTPQIWRANLDGTDKENLITSGTTVFRGLALDVFRNHMYWTANGVILRSDLDGTNEVTISTQLTEPEDIELDTENEMMYVVDGANNQIVRISYNDDPFEVVQSTNITDPQYLALDTRTMTPLSVVSTTPGSNGTGVNAGDNITITFDQNVDPFTLDNSTVLVIGSETGEINGTISGGATNVITFDPSADFKAGETIQITLSSDVRSMGGGFLTNGYFLEFTVISNPAPNAPPSFQEATIFDDGSNTGVDRVVAIDVNKDGNMDVVSIYEGIDDGVSWYQNDGMEQFTRNVAATPSMSFAETVAAADLDLDGDIDLLGAYNGRLDWYNNDGSFNFTETFIYQVGVGFGVQDIQVVDFDADGDLDIVGAFVSSLTHYIRWFENDGNNNFTNNIIFSSTTDRPNRLEVADVDDDGDADVLASFNGDAIGWLENDGTQSFTVHPITATSLTSQFEGFAAGDFNGDGHIDMAMTTTTQISWFVNDGSENFSENVISAFSGGNDLHAADLDGDGDIDLVGGSGNLIFYDNDGAGSFTARSTSTTTNIEDVFVTDLDSDGDLDVIAGGQSSRVVWFENTSLTSPEINVFVGPDVTGTALVDAQATAVDIGSASITNDITQSFTIENTGDALLTISSITSSATTYTVNGVPASVAVGAAEVFSITLDGSTAGTFATTITITNNDTNENPFTFPVTGEITGTNQPPDLSYIFYLDENSPNGTTLGAIVATDPEGDPLTYSIVSGNMNNAFALGSTTGILTVNDETVLDFETTPTFNLIVQADDGNDGVAMVSITVNLNDIIDENPLGFEALEDQVIVYPNPAKEILFVSLEGLLTKDLRVRLFTVSGSQVLTNSRILSRSGELIEIDLENLNSGIYLLEVKNRNEVIIKNILVK